MNTTARPLTLDREHPLAPPLSYPELRAEAPLVRVIGPDGEQAWLVTTFDVAATVLADARFGVGPPGYDPGPENAIFVDGPAHTRMRRLVGAAFGARGIRALTDRIADVTAERVQTLTAALAAPDAEADLVTHLAAPLALEVMGSLLGVPDTEQARFAELVDAMTSPDPFGGDPAAAEALGAAWVALGEYTAGLVAARRADPGQDLLSELIAARDADRLDDAELTALCAVLIAAGYEPARNGIAVAVLQLLELDALGDVAFDDPEQVDAVVEELLRRQSGITGEPVPRWAQTDLELAGVAIASGDRVLVRLGAANHDPARFDSPADFRPGREGAHLAFGRGPHHCLGAALARAELRAVVVALARELPDLLLDGDIRDIRWRHGYADSGPVAVPVTRRS